MSELRAGSALPTRARIRSVGGGGTPKRLALLALAVLVGLSALALTPAPARAQAGIAANITIDEADILGTLALRSHFMVQATVTDIYGDPIVGDPTVSWDEVPNDAVATDLILGRHWATYYVVAPGEVEITLTIGDAKGSITLQVGDPVVARPPEPTTVWITSPFSTRLASDHPNEVTANALVTDANGATVPDGTPVEWTVIGTGADNTGPHPGSDAHRWEAVSVEKTTTNGVATGTWRRSGANAGYVALVIARAGGASGSLIAEANRVILAPPLPAMIEIIESPSRWSLIEVGDSVTIRAKVTTANGDPVPDGTWVVWRAHEEGRALALNRLDVFVHTASGSPGLPGSPGRTGTTNGVASATYTARHPGVVWIRAYQTSGDARDDQQEHWKADVIAFNVGEYREPPVDLAFALRLVDDSDNVVPTGSTLRVGAELTYSGYGEREQALHITEGVLRVTGALDWDASYGALAVPEQSAISARAVLAYDWIFNVNRIGASALRGEEEGACKGVSDEGETDWTCTVDLGDSSITVPLGTEPGVYTVSAELTVNGREYRDLLELTVVEPGSLDEVAEVRFDFAPRERGPNRGDPYPSMIAAGESTRLRLTALNERGGASATGSIASVLFTTSAGTLSTSIGGGCVSGSGLSCQIPVSALTTSNSDKIDVTLTHPGPGKGGQANVRATLVTSDGETFNFPGVGASLTSAAASLAISEPVTSLLNAATGESDDRDVLRLTVSAADEAGNKVEVPYRAPRAVIRNAAGAAVSRGLSVVWTEDSDDADEAHDRFTRNSQRAVQATVRATADPASPLDAGEYTLELRTGGQTATRTFTVVGPPAALTLSGPEGPLQVDQAASFTATVRDAGGAPAPDGTPVEWSEQARADVRAVLVQISADATTTDGVATASYLPISSGSSAITAESGAARDVVRVEIQSAAAAAALAPTGSLTATETGAFTTWFGEGLTTASALLDGLPEVSSILLWQYGRWLRYGRVDGRVIPGSVNFRVASGAVLWLGE